MGGRQLMDTPELDTLGRDDSWAGVRAVVAGFGPGGFAAADNLLHLGADVLALDEEPGDTERTERAELLEVLGARVRLGPGSTATLPDDVDLLVVQGDPTAPTPLVAAARERGVPVWGEVDLAWRLRASGSDTPWLCVTGPGDTSDTAETVRVLEAILRAAGLRSLAVGEGGLPVVEAVMDPEAYDVLAVGLTPAQLRGAGGLQADSAAVLAVPAPDSPGAKADRLAMGRVYDQVRVACVYAVADPGTEELVLEADVREGARAIGVTLGMPGVGMVGLVEDLVADRAFIEERATSAAELGTLSDLPVSDVTAEPAAVRNALVAAALARAVGVPRAAVRDGLRAAPRD
ncbi:hypothetical protein [Nocardioides sp. zg-DK7169]|uniref:hypothetical protein n=1 Tax=Nocardioides sp. zg-DK7169 TaxID=2736600 RepID=UPI0015524BEC|nr:hypothetical protein [Nocardioides sp. zg-DK7169]NPC95384.1 hypothetical protein [Nocardioides sp. zg-DK7169]